jgi:hypothetical protein
MIERLFCVSLFSIIVIIILVQSIDHETADKNPIAWILVFWFCSLLILWMMVAFRWVIWGYA